MHVLPASRQWQRHQDALVARARRVQAELGAAVVDQVELDVPAASEQLPLALGVPVAVVLVLLQDGDVGGQHSLGARLHEQEGLLLAGRVDIVEEDATDATSFSAVLHREVVVAPGLEAAVVAGVVLVACLFQRRVEVDGVLLVEVVGREVGAAAEPPAHGLAVL